MLATLARAGEDAGNVAERVGPALWSAPATARASDLTAPPATRRHTGRGPSMSITRRQFTPAAAAASLVALTASPAWAQTTNENIKWRLTSSFPKSLDTLYGATLTIARIIGEMTDGKFAISTFAAGEIVPGLQVLDAVANGTVESGATSTGYSIGKNPAFIFDGSLPFGFTPRMQNAWLMFGDGRKLMDEIYDSFNVVSIPAGQVGGQMFGWFRKEIKSVQDFVGLKFRTAGFGGKVMGKLGAITQQIAGGDIYPALERGTIDGCEWVGPYDDEKLGFHKVAKYYYLPGVMELEGHNQLMIHKTVWARPWSTFRRPVMGARGSPKPARWSSWEVKMDRQAFATTVVGSMPKPPWLFTTATAVDGRRDHFAEAGAWSLTGEMLTLAQEDATRLAIHEQERAGVEIVSDGEQRRKNYVTHLTAAMGGFDYENFEMRTIRAGRRTVRVGRCVGPIEHRGPVLVDELRFAIAESARPVKVTLPGPMTVVDSTADVYYHDEKAMAFAWAAAINKEARLLDALGP